MENQDSPNPHLVKILVNALLTHKSQLLADRPRALSSSVLPFLDRFSWAQGLSEQQGVLSEVITWKGYNIHCLPCFDFFAGRVSFSFCSGFNLEKIELQRS